MRFITILPTERGVLWRSGQPVLWLSPGRHFAWSGTLTRLDVTGGVVPWSQELERIVPDDAAERIDVPMEHRGLLSIDGLPTACLAPGRWLVWKLRCRPEVQVVDTTDIATPIPTIFADHHVKR